MESPVTANAPRKVKRFEAYALRREARRIGVQSKARLHVDATIEGSKYCVLCTSLRQDYCDDAAAATSIRSTDKWQSIGLLRPASQLAAISDHRGRTCSRFPSRQGTLIST